MSRATISGRATYLTTTILDAVDDRNLFAPWFKDRNSWVAWFAFLAALFALPMTDEQTTIFQQCTGRAAPPTAPAREGWLVVGRRGGKSFILALCAVFVACFRDHRNYLAPGERGTVMVIARDRKQARTIFRFVGALLRVPLLQQLIAREADESYDLTNGVTIEVHTASYKSTRGYALLAALCDELAFWDITETAAEPDSEIIAALRPGMAQFQNALLLCASSPYARRGALWDAWRKHYGKDGDPILVWQAPTRRMNPTIPQAVIDEATERDPARAAAEYRAEFRADIEGFVVREVVEACVAPGVFERSPQPSIRYAAFVDPSGGSADSFTLAIAHRDADSLFLDAVREVRPPFSPEAVVAEFAATLKSYCVTKVSGDRYAGEWPREQFRKFGITYEVAAKTKSDIFRDLLPLLNSRKVELLDNAKLLAQLVGLERRTARGGRDSIDHAPGAHDDVANAAAGALLGSLNAHKRRTLFGSYGYGGGPITWRNPETGEVIDPRTGEPIERTRIRVVTIPEALAPAARGKS